MSSYVSAQAEISKLLLEYPELGCEVQRFDLGHIIASFRNITMNPERRAIMTVADYVARCVDFRSTLRKSVHTAKINGARLSSGNGCFDLVKCECEEFNSRVRGLFLDYIHSESRCANFMITGPARFPVERNRKRMEVSQRRYEAIADFSSKFLKNALHRLLPDGDGSFINSASSSAVEQMKCKISAAKADHERMKLINAIVRKYFPKGKPCTNAETQQKCIEHLSLELKGSTDEMRQYLSPCRLSGLVVPFPRFVLTNSNARIRNMEQRLSELVELEQNRNSDVISGALDNGIKYFLTDDNRIAIEFGYKPGPEIRKVIRDEAHFKFSARRGNLWIRKHTHNAERDFFQIVLPLLKNQ